MAFSTSSRSFSTVVLGPAGGLRFLLDREIVARRTSISPGLVFSERARTRRRPLPPAPPRRRKMVKKLEFFGNVHARAAMMGRDPGRSTLDRPIFERSSSP
jgi:hypothetical protein